MANAEISEVLAVDKDKLFATIVGYENYPKFVEGCTKVKVERSAPGRSRVTYHVSMMKDVVYTLDHVESPETGEISWTLVSSDTLKKNSGHWQLKSVGSGKTETSYELEIEFNIPVPGFILNRLVKGSLPAMLKSFEKQAKKT